MTTTTCRCEVTTVHDPAVCGKCAHLLCSACGHNETSHDIQEEEDGPAVVCFCGCPGFVDVDDDPEHGT